MKSEEAAGNVRFNALQHRNGKKTDLKRKSHPLRLLRTITICRNNLHGCWTIGRHS